MLPPRRSELAPPDRTGCIDFCAIPGRRGALASPQRRLSGRFRPVFRRAGACYHRADLKWRLRTALAVLIFVPYLAAAVLLQALSGAFQGDFGQSSDEPAHATTALMICSNQPCSPDKH